MYVETLADFYSNLDIRDVPYEVIRKARITLFDFLTVLLTGKYNSELIGVVKKYQNSKSEIEEAVILGTGEKKSAQTAALIMGMISHGVELDDGHRHGTCHPSVAVIPAVLAEGEKEDSTFEEMLKAIIVGYDCMLRTARAINPSHLKRGFHSTGTCGALGAGAAAAALKGYNSEKMAYTISISALQSSGFQEMLHGHPSIKALQPGKAAQAGILAAELVEFGAKGPLSIYEGQHGWLKGMTDEYREADLVGELGSRWEIMKTYTKLYPTCRHCHAPVDMALELFKKGFTINDIAKLRLETYNIGIVEVGLIKRPESFEETMFSVAYSMAVALKFGVVRIKEMKECLDDFEILEFASKIEIVEDEKMNCRYPVERGARVIVKLINGKELVLEQALPKGEYDTPLTDREYQEKAENILEGNVESVTLQKLWKLVVEENLQEVQYKDIIELMK